MFNSVKKFLRDEGGNATIESLVVIGGSVWMAGVVLTDISTATMAVTERLETRLEYRSIVEDVLAGYGTEEQQDSYSDPDDSGIGTGEEVAGSGDDGTDDEDDCVGNPGNDKCVGNAGENPNGGDDWGSGSNGMSDSGSTSSSNGGGRGNSSNAPGRNK